MTTAEQHLNSLQATRNLQSALVGLFSLIAVGLAIFGSYSVLQYATSRRAKEFGIRVAMGATRIDLVRSVLSQGMTVALIGIGAGLLGSLWLTRLLSGLLYGVSPFDGLTFVVATTVLTTVLMAASLVPALRSARVNPLDCLRHE